MSAKRILLEASTSSASSSSAPAAPAPPVATVSASASSAVTEPLPASVSSSSSSSSSSVESERGPLTVADLLNWTKPLKCDGHVALLEELRTIRRNGEEIDYWSLLTCVPPPRFPNSPFFYDILRFTALYTDLCPMPREVVLLVAEYDSLWPVDITPAAQRAVTRIGRLDDVEDHVFVGSDSVYYLSPIQRAGDTYALSRTSAGADRRPEFTTALNIRAPSVLSEDQRNKRLYLHGTVPGSRPKSKPCLCYVKHNTNPGRISAKYSDPDTESDLWAGEGDDDMAWICIGESYVQCVSKQKRGRAFIHFLDTLNDFEPGFFVEWFDGWDHRPAVRALDDSRVYMFHMDEHPHEGRITVYRVNPLKPRRAVNGEPRGIVDKVEIGTFMLPAASLQRQSVCDVFAYAAAHSPATQVIIHAHYGPFIRDEERESSLYSTSLQLIDLKHDKVSMLWSWQSCLELPDSVLHFAFSPQRFLQVGTDLILIIYDHQAFFVSLRERTVKHKHIPLCVDFRADVVPEKSALLLPPMGAIVKRTAHLVEYDRESDDEEEMEQKEQKGAIRHGEARVKSLFRIA